MAIELPPQNASSRPTQTQGSRVQGPRIQESAANPNQRLQPLIEALKLNIGDTVAATVKRLAPVTAQQRQLLLQNQSTGQPSRLTAELAQLLKSPTLQLAELTLRGTTLLTFTDKPLHLNQHLQLHLASATRLTLLTDKNQPQISTEQKLVHEALRTILPRKAPLSHLLQAVDTLFKQLPSQTLRTLLPTSLRQSLQSLQRHIHTPEQLAKADTLAHTLKNSGIQLEQQLNQLRTSALYNKTMDRQGKTFTGAATNAPQSVATAVKTTSALTGDLKGNLLRALSQLQHASKHSTSGPQQQNTANPRALEPLLREPLLREPLSKALTSTLSPNLLQSSSLSSLAHQGPKQQLPLLLFIQQLATLSPAKLSHKDVRTQLMRLLHQQLLTAVAKLQFQQMHSLSRQLSLQKEPSPQPQQSQSWQIELPVRYGNDVHSIEIQIEERWERKQDTEEQNSNRDVDEKKRQWEVMLSFELPDNGALHAQLKIIDNTVSANFWAEQTHTLDQAKQKLDDLRNKLQASGIHVESIQCFSGHPPCRDIQLGYSLVDITT